VGTVRRFLEFLPAEKVSDVLAHFVSDVPRRRINTVVLPLLNSPKARDPLCEALRFLNPATLIELVNVVELEKINIFMRVPAQKLGRLIENIEPGRASALLMPLLKEPMALLEGTLLPVIIRARHPEHLAVIANHVDISVLLPFVRGVEEMQIVSLLDSLCEEDFRPEGTVIRLLNLLSDDIDFLEKHLVPLVQRGDAQKIAVLLQGMRAEQFTGVLRAVSSEKLLLLLQNLNCSLVVRLCNGPLEELVPVLAGYAGTAMKKSNAIAAVSGHVGDQVEAGFAGVDSLVVRGKLLRGVQRDDRSKVGDFSRGLVSKLVLGQPVLAKEVSRCSEPFPYEVGDKVQIWSKSRLRWRDAIVQGLQWSSGPPFLASVYALLLDGSRNRIQSQEVQRRLRPAAHGIPSFTVGDSVRLWGCNCVREMKYGWIYGVVVDKVGQTEQLHDGTSIEEGSVWVGFGNGHIRLLGSSDFGRLLRHAPTEPIPRLIS
jgi:hypothetical protein